MLDLSFLSKNELAHTQTLQTLLNEKLR